ncbi:MAG: tRNA (N(6)-L-threonylcarbamoyladenosine(37)-C(2))-methylthiotransferase MtaB [Desulfobacterales bacterium]|jgi:threonylcarbamoyladenosine tRNA methylthiotransferase MtaB|nr:tRNA (N(6)-L-threonylcarbamoyladenosine(37)-C(2))-methylthiotransferase MtaB [Desulfobacterales bacterium]
MQKFKIITLGCKVNQAESEAIAGCLAAARWAPAAAGEAADICIVNTCAVTQRAGMQSRQALRRAIQENPGACVAATGCYAATDPQALMKIEGIGCVVGQKDKPRLAEIILASCSAECSPGTLPDLRKAGDGLERAPESDEGLPLRESIPASMASRKDAAPAEKGATSLEALTRPPTAPALPPAVGTRTRPFLRVQDGCDAFCAYCIVPYARGPSRSVAFGEVLDAVSRLAGAGYQEAVLTGIHLGAYGRDLEPRASLAELLQAILKRPDAIRIRLSSVEPLELSDEIIDLAAGSGRICRHFHVPLQSGDAQVLKRMGRPYTPGHFGQRIERVHQRIPDAAVGTDVLVGFPGETEAAFENTRALVEALPLTYLHVFPFSARPGTAAWSFGDRVPAERIRQRCRRLRQLGGAKRLAFHRRFVGRRVRVLAEGRRDPRTGLLKGVSSNYLPVLFEGGDDCIHRLVAVRISGADADRLHGQLTD